jgi:hypothetical protein
MLCSRHLRPEQNQITRTKCRDHKDRHACEEGLGASVSQTESSKKGTPKMLWAVRSLVLGKGSIKKGDNGRKHRSKCRVEEVVACEG